MMRRFAGLEKQSCSQHCLNTRDRLFLSLHRLPKPPLQEEASLLPGYNYQEGELPKPDLAIVCVWLLSCWEGHLPGVGSSWVVGVSLPPQEVLAAGFLYQPLPPLHNGK